MKPISLASALVLFAAVAAPLAVRAADFDDPSVTRKGKTVVQYKDDRVQVVVGYRYASTHLDSPWIFLDTYVSATSDKPIEIAREDVSLVLPDGTRLAVPKQKRLTKGLPDIRRLLQEASVSRDPLDGYFPGRIQQERIGFFTIPGEEITFDRFSANRNILASGDLFFEAPKGRFEPGRYRLEIYNKGVDVKLPLTLPAEDAKKDKDGKTIPW